MWYAFGMGFREDLDELARAMDEDNIPNRENWLWPPLVRHAKPESQWKDDPRWLAWNGLPHPDQTPLEVQIRDKKRAYLTKPT